MTPTRRQIKRAATPRDCLTAREKETIFRRIDNAKRKIAEARDELRGIYSELEELVESSDLALVELDFAVQRLSEHV